MTSKRGCMGLRRMNAVLFSRLAQLGWVSILGLVLGACQAEVDPELQQANAALRGMASPLSLSKSCFFVAYPNGQASDYLSFLLSDLGAAEWPVAMDEQERQQLKAIGQLPMPTTVSVSVEQRRYRDRKEVVLRADNGTRSVLVDGYLPNSDQVQLAARWQVGTAVPDAGVRALCQSSLEMGGSAAPRTR